MPIPTADDPLDAFRKARQAEHPRLTLTQMYNVLEKLKAMEAARSFPSPLWGGARGGGGGVAPIEDGTHTPSSISSPQGGGGLRRASFDQYHRGSAPKTRQVFWPPKPKELEST
jgi:hypothetical protein